jgi:hypothetical protein
MGVERTHDGIHHRGLQVGRVIQWGRKRCTKARAVSPVAAEAILAVATVAEEAKEKVAALEAAGAVGLEPDSREETGLAPPEIPPAGDGAMQLHQIGESSTTRRCHAKYVSLSRALFII